jgi:hypothetical protein
MMVTSGSAYPLPAGRSRRSDRPFRSSAQGTGACVPYGLTARFEPQSSPFDWAQGRQKSQRGRDRWWGSALRLPASSEEGRARRRSGLAIRLSGRNLLSCAGPRSSRPPEDGASILVTFVNFVERAWCSMPSDEARTARLTDREGHLT